MSRVVIPLLMLCLLHRRSAPSFVAAEPAVREGTEVPPAQTRCGGREHANLTRPCPRNDTYCGEWKGRFWHPIGCEYEHISPSKAAACLRNRTIAFIGDSHIRDLCFGLVYYLLETYTLDTAPESKFDIYVSDIGEVIGDFDFWKVNLPSNIHNGYTFPMRNLSNLKGIHWQIQYFSLYSGKYLDDGQLKDVLSNRLATLDRGLHLIDLAFVNVGLHDWGWFFDGDMGYKYFKNMAGRYWLRLRNDVSVPSVWTSMNPECIEKLSGTLAGDKKEKQVKMVEVSNAYVNQRFLRKGMPYFDFGALLRSPGRCEHSADGLHMKMYANVMAAIMLLNHLCDSNGNWRGGTDVFV